MGRVVDYDKVVDLLDERKLTAVAFPQDGTIRALTYRVAEWSPMLDEDDPDLREHHIVRVIVCTAQDPDARI